MQVGVWPASNKVLLISCIFIYISRKKWHNEKAQYIKSSKNKFAENVKVKVSLEKEIFHVYKLKHLDWNMLKINM